MPKTNRNLSSITTLTVYWKTDKTVYGWEPIPASAATTATPISGNISYRTVQTEMPLCYHCFKTAKTMCGRADTHAV